MPEVSVQGIVSARTREPLVSVNNEEGGTRWQMDTAAARHFAMTILDAAVEAERDAATVAYLTGSAGFGDEDAGRFLAAMRDHRKDWVEGFRTANVTMGERPLPPDALA